MQCLRVSQTFKAVPPATRACIYAGRLLCPLFFQCDDASCQSGDRGARGAGMAGHVKNTERRAIDRLSLRQLKGKKSRAVRMIDKPSLMKEGEVLRQIMSSSFLLLPTAVGVSQDRLRLHSMKSGPRSLNHYSLACRNLPSGGVAVGHNCNHAQ